MGAVDGVAEYHARVESELNDMAVSFSGLYPGMHYMVTARGREKGRDWVPINLPHGMRHDPWYYPTHPYAAPFESVYTPPDDDTSYFSLDVEVYVTCPIAKYSRNLSATLSADYQLPDLLSTSDLTGSPFIAGSQNAVRQAALLQAF